MMHLYRKLRAISSYVIIRHQLQAIGRRAYFFFSIFIYAGSPTTAASFAQSSRSSLHSAVDLMISDKNPARQPAHMADEAATSVDAVAGAHVPSLSNRGNL